MIMHPNFGLNGISYDICLLKTEEISLSDDDKGLNSEKHLKFPHIVNLVFY